MANRFIRRILHGPAEQADAPLGGTRAEAIQRLQVGLSGIGLMIILVALADVVSERAEQTDAASVPEAVATVEPESTEAPQSDPLAEAGVVPELPAEPDPTPTASVLRQDILVPDAQ
ncbi:hypothetical protein QWY75_07405 [Pontixanthobacter aestiaquae]|uniref:Uncharacterized protein n=1 Tax=Pontixanthobacter aestiaquae TaxID=1509367 RepID=A0A844ZAV3_9SPHN|nr:hypothetical protein [Pontixanthobacter aestiaquae]MDN3646029.1 hypothetical protein [Pontixanthobacter aestiaquae]MXO82979.1 hypothetical protein [Pontixanthobacter aestiaquae]